MHPSAALRACLRGVEPCHRPDCGLSRSRPFGVAAGLGLHAAEVVPVVALAWWFASSVRTGELVTALGRMRLPKTVTIPVAVMVRYLPTLGQEYACIRDTMRMRGIEASFPASLLHPLRATEFVLVPILMRCLKVADELAASAVSRGIESRASRHVRP